MATFTVRVELHHSDDYDTLHEAMEKEGFKRTITTKSGGVFHLPTAEYSLAGKYVISAVLVKVKRAANKTKVKYGVLITESTRRTIYGLDSADD